MSLRFLTAGESHGPALVGILDGLPAGLLLNIQMINAELARRQTGFGSGGRMKIEKDTIEILGGIMGGETTGAPISVLLKNHDHENWKSKVINAMTIPRPGHTDLTGAIKYRLRDLRPVLERASARETAMRVIIGAICKQFLAHFGISIGGYVRAIGAVQADVESMAIKVRLENAETNEMRCPDLAVINEMQAAIQRTIEAGDTLGGVIEIIANHVPIGLGSYVQADRRLDACLAKAIISVHAIKGVEIGDAFQSASLPGSASHDDIFLKGKNLFRRTNSAGGIEGGISNGMPILIRAAMKPIATSLSPHKTVDLATKKEALTKYERSDYCPVPRAVPILEAVTAIVIADALLEKLGGDSLSEMLPRFKALHSARLEDFRMDNTPRVWWE